MSHGEESQDAHDAALDNSWPELPSVYVDLDGHLLPVPRPLGLGHGLHQKWCIYLALCSQSLSPAEGVPHHVPLQYEWSNVAFNFDIADEESVVDFRMHCG